MLAPLFDRTPVLDTSYPPAVLHFLDSVTTSNNPDVKVSIDDLTDRIAMLGDVAGHVALIKRDLATLMRFYVRSTQICKPATEPQP